MKKNKATKQTVKSVQSQFDAFRAKALAFAKDVDNLDSRLIAAMSASKQITPGQAEQPAAVMVGELLAMAKMARHNNQELIVKSSDNGKELQLFTRNTRPIVPYALFLN